VKFGWNAARVGNGRRPNVRNGSKADPINQFRSRPWTLDLYLARLSSAQVLEKQMPRSKPNGPRLEALLDQLDRLRVKIGLAGSDGRSSGYDIGDLRRKLMLIDHAIIQQWEDPSAWDPV
jgi:hypothetical protein